MASPEQPLNRIGGGGASSSLSATPLQPWSFASGRLPVLLLCFLAAVAAISSQSLWIDEALTAMKAQQPTLAGWWRAMVAERASDLQMPLYMIYVWGWVKVFGASEWMLRAANLPWFLAGIMALGMATRGRNGRWTFLVLAAGASPFCWGYLNEARPYAMQLGASFLILAAIGRLSESELDRFQERRWTAGFAVGVGVLCGASLLGVVWAFAAMAAAWGVIPRSRRPDLWQNSRSVGLLLGVWLVFLGLYYLWTLRLGARASAAAGTSVKTLAFVGYELLGFSGLGPGRLALREAGPAALRGYEGVLGVYALVLLMLLAAGLRAVVDSGRSRSAWVIAVSLCGSSALLVLAGWIAHFRVLGRHFAPLAAVGLLLLSLGAAWLWRSRRWLARAAVLGFFVLSMWSSLSLRFAPRHQRDDYRDAAALARTALAAHRTVWWNANPQGAAYYRLPTTGGPSDPGVALSLVNPRATELDSLPKPDLVVTSKPDIYDVEGALAAYLQRNGFTQVRDLPAFAVWERPSN